MSTALLLIHGYPFDGTLWDSVRAGFPPGPLILAPDLRCAGGDISAEPSIELLAADLADLVRTSGIDRVFVAGMSMGGYVALAFAEKFPSMLAGLALISTQAAADTEEQKVGRRALSAKVRAEGIRPAVDGIMPKLFAAGRERDGDFSRLVREPAYRYGVGGIAWALEAMVRRPDRHAVLAAVTAPVLIMHGAEDRIIPKEKVEQMVRAHPTALFIELAETGHASPMESPRAIAGALTNWLRR